MPMHGKSGSQHNPMGPGAGKMRDEMEYMEYGDKKMAHTPPKAKGKSKGKAKGKG